MLRRLAGRHDAVLHRIHEAEAVMTDATTRAPDGAVPFPPGFAERMARLLGAETDAFLAALADPPAGLRANTLKVTPEQLRELAPFAFEPLAYPPAGFVVEGGERPGRHPYHAAGLYYLQDPAAMAVGALVDPRPGERVIDLAAAPGGKSTHLAALMEDDGLLVANDVHAGRARELASNLERFGVRNAVVTNESVDRLAAHFGTWFDRVLLDAPCSGEAMFHKSEAAACEWSEAAVLGCARRQAELLRDAARLVRPGGLLVYSTCTFSPEEDEAVIAAFLDEHPEFEMAALAEIPGAAPARPEWAPGGAGHPELARALRLWPHRFPGAGHFVAGMRRTGGVAGAPTAARHERPPRQAVALFEAFAGDALHDEAADAYPLALFGAELHRLPATLPDLGRLRVVRAGWWLGTVRKDRFEPSHHLALSLPASAFRRTVELHADDPDTHAYLRGEPLHRDGEPGWAVVTVDGFPLGWGKRSGATVKNHYPKGLRWR